MFKRKENDLQCAACTYAVLKKQIEDHETYKDARADKAITTYKGTAYCNYHNYEAFLKEKYDD